MPTRGLMSFQFATCPVQPAFRLFFPSEHWLKLTALFHVLAGRVSGSVALMNQSQRTPALTVARLNVHLSCAKIALSFLIELRRSVGMRRVMETGTPAL